MAAALDEILGHHLSKGIAIVKVAEERDVFATQTSTWADIRCPTRSGTKPPGRF